MRNSSADLSRYALWHRRIALAWCAGLALCAVLLVCLLLVWRYPIDTRILSLLPDEQRNPLAEAAVHSLAAQGERQLVILVGSPRQEEAKEALQALRQATRSIDALEEVASNATLDAAALKNFYLPYRFNLINAADLAWLQASDAPTLQARAERRAYSAFSAGLVAWKDDPFGFFNDWLLGLGQASPLRPYGDVLMRRADGQYFAALMLRLKSHDVLSVTAQEYVSGALNTALDTIQKRYTELTVLRAGLVWHAATAMKKAESEIALIGGGSLVASLLLIFLVFRNFAALRLVLASLLAGFLLALPVTWLVFGSLHLVTLTFSASLIGVAVDYGILIATKRLARAGATQHLWAEHRALLPAMSAVLIAPLIAYGGIILLPFPGFRQMALFAVLGIAGAWATIMLGYPYLLAKPLPSTACARKLISQLQRLPRWRASRAQIVVSLLLIAVIAAGISRLRTDDNVRHLISSDPQLVDEQVRVSQLLQLPSPAQMFLIDGDSPEIVLQREEALLTQLQAFIAAGKLTGFDHITRWLPSEKQQRAVADAEQKLLPVRTRLAQEWGLAADWVPVSNEVLSFATWQASPLSEAARHLWLHPNEKQWASIVLLKGLTSTATADELARLAQPHITWVDKTGEISGIMKLFRERLTWVIAIAYLLVPLALAFIYRKKVWRVVVPSLLATLGTLAVMGFCGIPCQMIAVLALLLVFGMGMDYGLFLVSQDRDERSLLSISVAALLTLCSFGLLAFSSMPVLRVLGIVVTVGVALAWWIMLWFRADPHNANQQEEL